MPEDSMPPELLQALQSVPELYNYFASLSPSHQREYINYIAEAKKPETHSRRVATTLDMLRAKHQRISL